MIDIFFSSTIFFYIFIIFIFALFSPSIFKLMTEENRLYRPILNRFNKRFDEFLGKRFSEFMGKKKRLGGLLGGKKRFSEFMGR